MGEIIDSLQIGDTILSNCEHFILDKNGRINFGSLILCENQTYQILEIQKVFNSLLHEEQKIYKINCRACNKICYISPQEVIDKIDLSLIIKI